MKIYFSFSLSQSSTEIRDSVPKIVDIIKKMGHKVFPKNLERKDKNYLNNQNSAETKIAQKEIRKLKRLSDIIILEVSSNSIGIGQELTFSLSIKKPVIALYRDDTKPHILEDATNDLLTLASYNKTNLHDVLKYSIKHARDQMDTRFNMMLSPKLSTYLKEAAGAEGISKATFIRQLLKEKRSKTQTNNQINS